MTLIIPPSCQRHGVPACSRCIVAGDEGKRIADIINMLVTFKGWDELEGGYVAFKLEDGSSDGTLYDSYEAALKHTDETRCAYFCMRQAMGGASPRDAQIWLELNRYAVAANLPRVHPETRRNIMPILSIKGYEHYTGRSDNK